MDLRDAGCDAANIMRGVRSGLCGGNGDAHHGNGFDDDDDDSAAVQAPAAKENSGSPDSHVGKSPLKDENDRKKATEQEDESEDE